MISRIYVMAKTFDELNAHLRARPHTPEARPWEGALVRSTPSAEGASTSDSESKSWKFQYESWGISVSLPTQRSVYASLSDHTLACLSRHSTSLFSLLICRKNLMSMSHLELPGKIDLKHAEVEFGVYEECESAPPVASPSRRHDLTFSHYTIPRSRPYQRPRLHSSLC